MRFPFLNVDLGITVVSVLQNTRYSEHWGRRGAHLNENKGMKSECKKFGENSRETASVSTIFDEYCSPSQVSLHDSKHGEHTYSTKSSYPLGGAYILVQFAKTTLLSLSSEFFFPKS